MAQFDRDFRDGVDINLGVGFVNEGSLPGAELADCLGRVLADGLRYRQPLNYGDPTGTAALHGAIRRYLLRNRVGGLDEAALSGLDMVVGCSGATSLLAGLCRVFSPGLVVTSDPTYYIYADVLARSGFRLLSIPEDGSGLLTDRLEARLEALGESVEDLRFFYVVTVGNPTSTVLSNARRSALLRIARRVSQRMGRAVPVILDRAYEELVHGERAEPIRSSLLEYADLAVEVGTLAKIVAPALRIGYALGRAGPLLRSLVQYTSDAGFHAPIVNQMMAAEFLDRYADGHIAKVKAAYRQRSEQTRRAIETHLGPWLEDLRGGEAGFYFYLTLRGVETHEQSRFFAWLGRRTGDAGVDGPAACPGPRVVYLPGEHFVDPGGELLAAGRRQLRISYGYEAPEAIVRGIGLMGEAAAWAARG